MAQRWEHSPPTTVTRVRFPDPASLVGWVYCWFSSLLRQETKALRWIVIFAQIFLSLKQYKSVINYLSREQRISQKVFTSGNKKDNFGRRCDISQIAAIFLELVPRSVEQWCPWEWVRTKKRKSLVGESGEEICDTWSFRILDFSCFVLIFVFRCPWSFRLENVQREVILLQAVTHFYEHNQEKSWQSKHPGCCFYQSIKSTWHC